MLRAAEVTIEHGFKYFVLVESQRYTKMTGAFSNLGNIQFISKPRTENIIMCYKAKPNINAIVYDAKIVYNAIRGKYKIGRKEEYPALQFKRK